MGLDMYAFTLARPPCAEVDFNCGDRGTVLHTWRKHPNLHGWFERLYYAKGGTSHRFNCDNLVLTRQDLDRLEADLRAMRLPHTTGFFFGESDGSELDDDLQFVAEAREAIAARLTVVYSSWW